MFAVIVVLLASINAEAHPQFPQSNRRLWSWAEKVGHMWGPCSFWDRDNFGCNLYNPKCSDHLSPGPDDADIEIRLGGLPPSTSDEPVHLHWWAPRKSPTKFNLLESPVNVSVYADIRDAYPKYYDNDFNGGNIRITEFGEAVIKVRSPATYYVSNWVAIPHIHLRICRGNAFSTRGVNGVMFGLNEQWVLTSSTGESFQIISATSLAPMIVSSTNPDVPSPVAIITGVCKFHPGSTSLSDVTTSTFTTTSTLNFRTTSTFTTTSTSNFRDVQISVAKDSLDLDALEFSPIYQCFMDNQFFDHFSAECTDTCPADSVVKHGQCVREISSNTIVSFDATWELEVKCGSHCWHDKKNATLHWIRLSVAGHFNIPFQEVDEVTLGFDSAIKRRRLEDTTVAYLRISVETRRYTKGGGEKLLVNFLPDATTATDLLGFEVHGVEHQVNPVDTSNLPSMDKDTDPYNPAYKALEKSSASAALTSSPSEFLPAVAVIGIAAGVIIVGILLATYAFWRRRRANLNNAAAKGKEIDNEVADKTASMVI